MESHKELVQTVIIAFKTERVAHDVQLMEALETGSVRAHVMKAIFVIEKEYACKKVVEDKFQTKAICLLKE